MSVVLLRIDDRVINFLFRSDFSKKFLLSSSFERGKLLLLIDVREDVSYECF